MNMVEIALQYAERGWRVFPLYEPLPSGDCSCRKETCTKVGKHPRIKDWPNNASTDEKTIRAWWSKWPEANIGVLTGAASNLLVLDVDDKNNGQGTDSLFQLEQQYYPLPDTPAVKTGFGRHYYFSHPGVPILNRVGKIGAGLDIRADNGYVVAPPSIHANGAIYEWIVDDAPLAPAPDWLLRAVQDGNSVSLLETFRQVAPKAGALAPIPEGQRNHDLFLAASSMRGRGMGRGEIEDRLVAINASLCETPLPLREVKGIAESVSRYIPGKRPAATIGLLKGQNRLVWMKLFPADILGDRWLGSLPPYQFGWRMRLWFEAWERGGILPNDVTALARLAGERDVDLFAREMECVLYDFQETRLADGFPALFNPELVELFAAQMATYRQTLEASAKGVEAKKAKREREQTAKEQGEDPSS